MKYFAKDLKSGEVKQFGVFYWAKDDKNWYFGPTPYFGFGPENLEIIRTQLLRIREDYPNGPIPPDYDLAS